MTPPNTRVMPYSEAAVAEAAALIAAGGCVAVPTETVYGLAADATSGQAVARVYEAKGRPAFNPLIVHVSSIEHAEALAVFDDASRDLARRYWPGPLTLVLPSRNGSSITGLATAGLATIALRVPRHRAMRALLDASGRPLAAPSANASGRLSPTTAAHVLATLKGRISLIIDDGASENGLESTIVAAGPKGLRLLRHGAVTGEELGLDATQTQTQKTQAVQAPGQLASHYRPSKPLVLDRRDAQTTDWLIGFGAVTGDASLSPGGDLVEAAANLFARLHEADVSNRARIAVAPIPHEGLGAAINDRLARAAA